MTQQYEITSGGMFYTYFGPDRKDGPRTVWTNGMEFYTLAVRPDNSKLICLRIDERGKITVLENGKRREL